MTSDSYDQVLDRAAETCGVEPRFWDIFGREHVASKQARQAIVQSLGISIESAESMDAALSQRLRLSWTRVLPLSIVATENEEQLTIPITLPESELEGIVRFRIQLEMGETVTLEQPLPGLAIEERWAGDGGWVRVQVKLRHAFPLGYHTIDVEAGARRASSRLIVAPAAAWQPESLRTGGKTAGLRWRCTGSGPRATGVSATSPICIRWRNGPLPNWA